MGLKQLPNGMEYYSISEELQAWVTSLYSVFTPINVGVFVIMTLIAASIIVYYIFRINQKVVAGA